jgi:hypothetical protein
VPFLAVFWADGERAGDDGMAVANGKWAQSARWKDGPIFTSELPVGRPYKPSVSPTSSTKSQVMKSTILPGPNFFYPLQIFRHGYCRFELCPILEASFEPNTLQTCFTAYMREWQIWPDNQLTRPASVTAQ